MRYIEFCCGAGGTRIGLDAAGWRSSLAIDADPFAVDVYNSFSTKAVCANIEEIDPHTLPQHDVVVAGFPCQPFSSSGPRLGFKSQVGNVFEHIVRIVSETKTPLLFLENVCGLLKHDGGRSFRHVLSVLTSLDYTVHWSLVNLKWWNVPQSRPRLIIVAYLAECRASETFVFSTLGRDAGIGETTPRRVSLQRPSKAGLLGQMGMANGGHAITWEAIEPDLEVDPAGMGRLVAPRFPRPTEIKSVRFYARGKGTSPFFRQDGIAHCIGNIPGGAPLFAIPSSIKRGRGAFVDQGNWIREQDDHLIIRLRPETSLGLFGPGSERLMKPMLESKATLSKKYQLVANLFASTCVEKVASMLSHEFPKLQTKRNGRIRHG